MALLSLEHSRTAYGADFLIYGVVIAGLAVSLFGFGLHPQRLQHAAIALLGLASWTVIEYAMHRFILHGLQPFRRWHAAHHERPQALIYAPTLLSGGLIATLVFLPALVIFGWSVAGAFTLGILIGYFIYSVIHHASHHWRADSAWLKKRKRWHAMHHQYADHPRCYGVTTAFWDCAFGTARP